MKPFDLEKALAGEPVELRNGGKAYVKFRIPNDYGHGMNMELVGFCVSSDNTAQLDYWYVDGRKLPKGCNDCSRDIIGMWEDKSPRVILDLPAPVKSLKIDDEYFYITSEGHVNFAKYNSCPPEIRNMERGLCFRSRNDAQEWVDAMKGARR